jgi:hypothetical protein
MPLNTSIEMDMNDFFKKVLPAWKWIIPIALLDSFFTAFLSKHILSGVNPFVSGIVMTVTLFLILGSIILAISLHKNRDLKGEMPFWVAFAIVICICGLCFFLHEYTFNLLVYGQLSDGEMGPVRQYYSLDNETESPKNYNWIYSILVFIGLAISIARLTMVKPTPPNERVLDEKY